MESTIPLPESGGPIYDYWARHGSRLARRCCAICGVPIPNRRVSGYCPDCVILRVQAQWRAASQRYRDRVRSGP
jgi:hypothetical protein